MGGVVDLVLSEECFVIYFDFVLSEIIDEIYKECK